MTEQELTKTLPQHLIRCAVPPAFLSKLLEPLSMTPAMDAVSAWIESPQLTLVLGGAVGSGKTLAACFALTKHKRCFDVFVHEPGDIPPDWRWSGGTFAAMADFQNRSLWDDEDRDFRDRVAATSLLILDDVGSERGDGSAVQSLLSSRMAATRRTIITTNLPGDAFRLRYGARVMDRIRENGTFANTGAKSMRGAA